MELNPNLGAEAICFFVLSVVSAPGRGMSLPGQRLGMIGGMKMLVLLIVFTGFSLICTAWSNPGRIAKKFSSPA